MKFKGIMVAGIISLAGISMISCKGKYTDKMKMKKTYDKYLKQIESLDNLGELDADLYYNKNVGDKHFLKGIKGKLDSAEILEENEEYLIAKIILDVTDPGLTTLEVGKNEKYICVTKVMKNISEYVDGIEKTVYRPDEFGVLCIDNPEAVNLNYEKFEDTDEFYEFISCEKIYNEGFGFKDSENEYLFEADYEKEANVDLNKDGIVDTISFEKIEDSGEYYCKMYINKGKDNGAEYLIERKQQNYSDYPGDYYRIMDFDKNDNYLDIVMDSYSGAYEIYRYDGKEISLYTNVIGKIKYEFTDNGDCIIE
ncbi:MAG: hypothetical protein K6G26_09265 [Lachnospiraceae bacterium]|nr:hypothetical protein [Lachnospiraceae bacterium]